MKKDAEKEHARGIRAGDLVRIRKCAWVALHSSHMALDDCMTAVTDKDIMIVLDLDWGSVRDAWDREPEALVIATGAEMKAVGYVNSWFLERMVVA